MGRTIRVELANKNKKKYSNFKSIFLISLVNELTEETIIEITEIEMIVMEWTIITGKTVIEETAGN